MNSLAHVWALPAYLMIITALLLPPVRPLDSGNSIEDYEDLLDAIAGHIDRAPPMKPWPPNLDYPQCGPFIDGSRTGLNRTEGRIRLRDSQLPEFGTNCSDIFERGYYLSTPLSEEEADYPIAFANILYKV